MRHLSATKNTPLAQKDWRISLNGRHWLSALARQTKIPYRTHLRWWHTFCREEGVTLRPMQATPEHREAFFTWVRATGEEGQAVRDAAQARTTLRALATRYGAAWLVDQVLRPAEDDARAQDRAQMAKVVTAMEALRC